MINAILIILEMLICYATMIFLYKKYKLEGIYLYSILATVISFITIIKEITVFGVTVPLGFSITTSLIIGGNILTQLRGKEELKKYIGMISLTYIISYAIIKLSIMFENSTYNLITNNAYNSIFENTFRIYLAFIISTIISTYLSAEIYYILKRIKNKLVISNILTVIIIGFFENIIYILVAYLFEWDYVTIILCIIFRYLIKTIIGMLGTIPIHIICKNIE